MNYRSFIFLIILSFLFTLSFVSSATPDLPQALVKNQSNQQVFSQNIPQIPQKPTYQTCISFNYSSWDQCNSSSLQKRRITYSNPNGCSDGSPILNRACNYSDRITNQTTMINQSEDNENQQNLPQVNNRTKDQETILSEGKKEHGVIKTFFVKFLCKVSNLFNKERYNLCVESYF